MCDPTAIAIGAFAINAAGSVAGHAGQAQASGANKKNALEAFQLEQRNLDSREFEERLAARIAINDTVRQSDEAAALASVSAVSAGVAGGSVRAVLNDLAQDRAEALGRINKNLDLTADQLERERSAAQVRLKSRIAGVPEPNIFATGLRIGAAGVDLGTSLYRINTP